MPVRFFYAAFFMLSVLCGAAAPGFCVNEAPPQFFQAMEDLPLMPGLYETPDETVVFDKPGGRILEIYAVSETLQAQDITRFYEEALPQTGWIRAGPGRFSRGAEALLLDIATEKGVVSVHFRILPRAGTGINP